MFCHGSKVIQKQFFFMPFSGTITSVLLQLATSNLAVYLSLTF